MRAVDVIARKRDGAELTTEEIDFFIKSYTEGTTSDYQASAWLMAVYLRGMSRRETIDLTMAMVRSETSTTKKLALLKQVEDVNERGRDPKYAKALELYKRLTPEVRARFQYYEELEAVHRGSDTMPGIPEYPAINEVLSRMTWDAVQGRKSVGAALREASDECAALLAHYRS